MLSNKPISKCFKIPYYFYTNRKQQISDLENEGHKHAYIDEGITIQEFINLKQINEITVTKATIILGEGIPLFGKTVKDIK